VLIHVSQLGDVRTALTSAILAHEEKYDVRFVTIIGKPDLAAAADWQAKVGSRRAYDKFVRIG